MTNERTFLALRLALIKLKASNRSVVPKFDSARRHAYTFGGEAYVGGIFQT